VFLGAASLAVGVAGWRWASRGRNVDRAYWFLPAETRRSVLAHEVLGDWPWLAVAAAIVGGLAYVAWFAPAILAAASLLRSSWPTGPGAVVTYDGGFVDFEKAEIVASPPIMFRGLVGWNLGLGLGPEEAAWAGQLARAMGLGDLLAEPESAAEDSEAYLIEVCRAIASSRPVVVLEAPHANLDQKRARQVAGMLAASAKTIDIASSERSDATRFLERVGSRPR